MKQSTPSCRAASHYSVSVEHRQVWQLLAAFVNLTKSLRSRFSLFARRETKTGETEERRGERNYHLDHFLNSQLSSKTKATEQQETNLARVPFE
jgi:hypothetical protein